MTAVGPTELPAAPPVLVVHCSDYRWRRAFDEFIENTLAIVNYDRIAVPGGPQCLVALEYLPKLAWAGNRWSKFLVEAHGLTRVVLIAHQECGWYRHLYGASADLEAQQRRDLSRAREQLRQALPGATVETYLATMQEGKAGFLRLDA